MKKMISYLAFSLLFGGMGLLFAACESDDGAEKHPEVCLVESQLDQGSDGMFRWPSLSQLSKADFEQMVVGRGWYCEAGFRVASNGFYGPSTSLKGMFGVGPEHYYFDRDSLTRFFYNDARGHENGGLGYVREAYVYNEDDNGVYVDGRRLMQFRSPAVDAKGFLFAIEHMGSYSDGTSAYAVCVFRPLSPRELSVLRSRYSVKWR